MQELTWSLRAATPPTEHVQVAAEGIPVRESKLSEEAPQVPPPAPPLPMPDGPSPPAHAVDAGKEEMFTSADVFQIPDEDSNEGVPAAPPAPTAHGSKSALHAELLAMVVNGSGVMDGAVGHGEVVKPAQSKPRSSSSRPKGRTTMEEGEETVFRGSFSLSSKRAERFAM